MSELIVRVDETDVAVVRRMRSGAVELTYAAQWLATPGRFAISHSLPLRAEPFGIEAERFLGNLLPEAAVRVAVCRRLGISEDNDFELLRAIGSECAGALSIVEPSAPRRATGTYRRLDDEEIEGWLRGNGYAAAVAARSRLSLAGAQDKVGVLFDGEHFFLPRGRAASTHVLKLPNRDFAGLPHNEQVVLELARLVGLPTVSASLVTRFSTPILLVERFDRIAPPPIERRHQEDFCQALGLDRRHKYEAEGGPSFAQCLELVREVSSEPLLDSRALLRWLVFCAVVGNRDNHAKNLALLRSETGRWRLAPFYDLVCTTAYPRLSRNLAMRIGGRTDGGNLPVIAWQQEARTLGVRPAYLVELATDVVDAVVAKLPEAVASAAASTGGVKRVVAVREAIIKGVRSVRRGLAQA